MADYSSATGCCSEGGSSGWDYIEINTSTVMSKSNVFFLVDTSQGPVEVTLLANPESFTRVAFLDVKGTFNVNPLTIIGGTIMGSTEALTASTPNMSFELLSTSTQDWRIVW